jgi:hypothetical protein
MTEIEICDLAELLFQPFKDKYPDLYITNNCRKYDRIVFQIGYKKEEPSINMTDIEVIEFSISTYINLLFTLNTKNETINIR